MALEQFARLCELLRGGAPSGIASAFGYSVPLFDWSVELTVAGWEAGCKEGLPAPTAPAVREARSLASPFLALLPRNSPAPLLNTIAAAVLANCPVELKPATGDEGAVAEWIAHFRNHGIDRIGVSVATDLRAYGKVVVYGSDETVESVRAGLDPRAELLDFGHRFSAALVDPSEDAAAHNLARDCVAWDQRGCLSPGTAFVRGDRRQREAFAGRLAAELALFEERLPRARPDAATSLEIRTLRTDVALRERGKVFGSSRGTEWTVLCDDNPKLEETPVFRTIWIKPALNIKDVAESLSHYRSHIEAIGVSERIDREELKSRVELEDDQVLPLGTMQSPPLTRRHSRRVPLIEWFTGVRLTHLHI